MLLDAAWGFAGGVAGGTISGVAVQWYGHRLRVGHQERSARRDAVVDLVISLERLEDAWQPATAAVPAAPGEERVRALAAVHEDVRAHQTVLGPDLLRGLRARLAHVEAAIERQDPVAVRRAVRQTLAVLAGAA